MTQLLMVAFVTVSGSEFKPQSYNEAYRDAVRNERAMIVVLGAEWCGACQELKNHTLPQVAQHGGMDNVSYTYVDIDKQEKLGRQLLKGDRIPQMLRVTWKGDKTMVSRLNGAPSVDEVSRFVNGKK